MSDLDDDHEINRRALEHMGYLFETLWDRDGRPSTRVIRLNPNADRRVRHFHVFDPWRGRWGDLEQAGVEGNDLVDLVKWFVDLPSRAEAVRVLKQILDGATAAAPICVCADPAPRDGVNAAFAPLSAGDLLSRRAGALWPTIAREVVDARGWPTASLRALNPRARPIACQISFSAATGRFYARMEEGEIDADDLVNIVACLASVSSAEAGSYVEKIVTRAEPATA